MPRLSEASISERESSAVGSASWSISRFVGLSDILCIIVPARPASSSIRVSSDLSAPSAAVRFLYCVLTMRLLLEYTLASRNIVGVHPSGHALVMRIVWAHSKHNEARRPVNRAAIIRPMRRERHWSLVIYLFAAAMIGLPGTTRPAIVDPQSPRHPVLDRLASALDASKIDVRRRWETGGAATGERPVVAPLDGYPASVRDLGVPEQFKQGFEAGAYREAVLVAVSGHSGQVDMSSSEFRAAWNSAEASRRVFISFTKADLQSAEAVRTALMKNGYVVFTYVTGAAGYRPAKPVEVGTYFKEAGHHFVIDTSNARKSPGVVLEAITFDRLRRGQQGGGEPIRTVPPETRSGDCCKLCYYRGGVLVRCDPPTCGPQCANARP